jgi:hypothetical protein
MSKAGEELTVEECDENIAIHYKIVKKNSELWYHHHYSEMDKSLDRRLELTKRASKSKTTVG